MFIPKYGREERKARRSQPSPPTRHCRNCACAGIGRGAARDVLCVAAAAAARTRHPMSAPPRRAGKQSEPRPPSCPPGFAALLAERRRGAPERLARVSESRGAGAAGKNLPRPEPRESKGRAKVRRGAPAVAGRSARMSAGHGAAEGRGGAAPTRRPRAPWREMRGNQATPRQECRTSPQLTRQPENQLRAWAGGRARQTHACRLPAGGGRDQQPRRAGCGKTAFPPPPRKSRLPGQSTDPRRPAVLNKQTVVGLHVPRSGFSVEPRGFLSPAPSPCRADAGLLGHPATEPSTSRA